MAVEIERKFLVRDESWRAHAGVGVVYRQGYVSTTPTCSIRVRRGGGAGYINFKTATLGITRREFDYPIPEAEADELLDLFAEGPLIEKTRYHVHHAGHLWEIDEFAGDNAGLIVAEIELQAADEHFARPPWLGAEVSHDRRYYNVCLVRHPYKLWAKIGCGAP